MWTKISFWCVSNSAIKKKNQIEKWKGMSREIIHEGEIGYTDTSVEGLARPGGLEYLIQDWARDEPDYSVPWIHVSICNEGSHVL